MSWVKEAYETGNYPGLRLYPGLEPARLLELVDKHIAIDESSVKASLLSDYLAAFNSNSQIIAAIERLGSERLGDALEKLFLDCMACQPMLPTYLRAMAVIDGLVDRREGRQQRDSLTAHSYEISVLTVLAAIEINRRELRYSEQELEKAFTAALLHDIGKLDVRLIALWTAPRELTRDEREKMKAHVVYGKQLIELGGFDPEIAESVVNHHERADGSGYNGKRLNEISSLAALIDAADKFGAMYIARRKYRQAPLPNFWQLYLTELYGSNPRLELNNPFGEVYLAFSKLFTNGN